MERRYAGPLGRLARLLLWEAREITLSRAEARALCGSVRAKLLSIEALIDEQEAQADAAQADLPWKVEKPVA